MATRRTPAGRRSSATRATRSAKAAVNESIELGTRDAQALLRRRARTLAVRAAVIDAAAIDAAAIDAARQARAAAPPRRQRGVRAAAEAAPAVSAARMRALGPPSDRILVAEGDSWFDYPWTDVLSVLDDEFGFDVESVAHKGDSVEQMAYDGGQLDDFVRRIEKLARRQTVPEAILLSGGGNDVAGNEFAVMLNHAQSGAPGLNPNIAAEVIDVRLHAAYVRIIAAVTEVCRASFGRVLPIVLHGYDYPVPDGRGFLGGFSVLPGPWLDPGFRGRGYGGSDVQMTARMRIIEALMDRFNEMLARLVREPAFAHVHYVNLRGTLSTAPATYKRDWANELHPSPDGFRAVTAKIARAIDVATGRVPANAPAAKAKATARARATVRASGTRARANARKAPRPRR